MTLILGAGGAGFGIVVLILARESLVGLVFAAFGLLRFVGWFFRTYEVTDRELVIRSGVLQRRKQVVPFQRVQQIDFHRGLVAQVFGLTEMRIETAGSAAGRVQLAYLDQSTGDALRGHLLERRAHFAGERVAPAGTREGEIDDKLAGELASPRRLVTISVAQLARAGLTSDVNAIVSSVWAGAALVLVPIAVLDRGAAPAWWAALATSTLFTLVWCVFTTVRFCVTYVDLRLDLVGDDLRIEYGLLARQHLSLPRTRVQHVSISDNLLRRRLGLCTLALHSAARPGADNATRLAIDGLVRSAVEPLLAAALPAVIVTPTTPRNGRTAPAARRAVVRRFAVLALVGVLPAVVWFPFGALGAGVGALGVPWGRSAHRRAGYWIDDRLVGFESGVIVHRLDLVPRARVQSVRVVSSWFQRRVGLATLIVDVAGHAPQIYDIDGAVARSARDGWWADQTRGRIPSGS